MKSVKNLSHLSKRMISPISPNFFPQKPLSFSPQTKSTMLEPTPTESDHHQAIPNPVFDPNWRSGRFRNKTSERENYRRNLSSDGVEFHPGENGSGSGIHSPPLWKSSSPPGSPSYRSTNFRSLSPASRTQAIVRGQRELMEMVKIMPENSYELSLKDLVEHHNANHQHIPSRMGSPKEESCLLDKKSYDDGDREEPCKRTAVEEEDVFVKMTVFPVSFKSMKTLKKKKSSNNSYAAVSPAVAKPEVTPVLDKEQWWKKRFSGSSGSESGVTNSSSNPSGSSGSSGSCSSRHSHGGRRPVFRRRNGLFRSCLTCFYSPKGSSGD